MDTLSMRVFQRIQINMSDMEGPRVHERGAGKGSTKKHGPIDTPAMMQICLNCTRNGCNDASPHCELNKRGYYISSRGSRR